MILNWALDEVVTIQEMAALVSQMAGKPPQIQVRGAPREEIDAALLPTEGKTASKMLSSMDKRPLPMIYRIFVGLLWVHRRGLSAARRLDTGIRILCHWAQRKPMPALSPIAVGLRPDANRGTRVPGLSYPGSRRAPHVTLGPPDRPKTSLPHVSDHVEGSVRRRSPGLLPTTRSCLP